MIAIWLNDTSPPRIRGGASSEMYIGLTNEAAPTARPRRNRKPTSVGMLCANADPSAPAT